MATTPIPPQVLIQSANSTVQVDSAQAVKAVIPTITLGDVINVTVRQNFTNGQGLLYYQGALIPAKLPGYLQSGDQLTAKVTQDSASLLFKILDLQRPADASPSTVVASRLEQFIAGNQAPLLRGMTSFEIPANVATNPAAQAALAGFEAAVGGPDMLGAPGTVLTQLTSSTDGTLAATLRDIASSLRTVADSYAAGGQENLAQVLHRELGRLAQQGSEFNPSAVKDLLRLVADAESKGQEGGKAAGAADNNALRVMLDDLQQSGRMPARMQNLVSTVLQRLETAIANQAGRADANAPVELRRLAARLDQMAASQEMLNQLNPLMQALGEPALILFPSLFQGLISHSELYVQPRSGGRKQQKQSKNKRGSEDDSEEGDGPDSSSYQRVQMTVPLPTLGLVGVDIAHRQTEILVRLTVPDEEVARFLLDQLEYLAIVLKDMGFETAELVANVGLPRDDAPEWCSGLQKVTKVIA